MTPISWLRFATSMTVILMGYLYAAHALYLALHVSLFWALAYSLIGAAYGVAGYYLPRMIRVEGEAR